MARKAGWMEPARCSEGGASAGKENVNPGGVVKGGDGRQRKHGKTHQRRALALQARSQSWNKGERRGSFGEETEGRELERQEAALTEWVKWLMEEADRQEEGEAWGEREARAPGASARMMARMSAKLADLRANDGKLRDSLIKSERAVEAGKIAISTEGGALLDVGLREEALDALMELHPAWLAAGVEAIGGRCASPEDARPGRLRRRLWMRVLAGKEAAELPACSGSQREEALLEARKAFLRRVIALLASLDRAQEADVREEGLPPVLPAGHGQEGSMEGVLRRALLGSAAGEGDIARRLRQVGVRLIAEREAEAESALGAKWGHMTLLAGAMTSGERLCKLVEVLTGERAVLSYSRRPVRREADRVYNCELGLYAACAAGMFDEERVPDAAHRVAEGHREGTVGALWELLERGHLGGRRSLARLRRMAPSCRQVASREEACRNLAGAGWPSPEALWRAVERAGAGSRLAGEGCIDALCRIQKLIGMPLLISDRTAGSSRAATAFLSLAAPGVADLAASDRAARLIQAAWRRGSAGLREGEARQSIRRVKAAALLITAVGRLWVARRAATRVQLLWRLARAKSAATRVQAAWRGFTARKWACNGAEEARMKLARAVANGTGETLAGRTERMAHRLETEGLGGRWEAIASACEGIARGSALSWEVRRAMAARRGLAERLLRISKEASARASRSKRAGNLCRTSLLALAELSSEENTAATCLQALPDLAEFAQVHREEPGLACPALLAAEGGARLSPGEAARAGASRASSRLLRLEAVLARQADLVPGWEGEKGEVPWARRQTLASVRRFLSLAVATSYGMPELPGPARWRWRASE